MEQWFELWDAESASLVGTYDTRDAALAAVLRSLATFGPDAIRSLVLTAEDDSDADPRPIASGQDLIDLARRSALPLATAGSGGTPKKNA